MSYTPSAQTLALAASRRAQMRPRKKPERRPKRPQVDLGHEAWTYFDNAKVPKLEGDALKEWRARCVRCYFDAKRYAHRHAPDSPARMQGYVYVTKVASLLARSFRLRSTQYARTVLRGVRSVDDALERLATAGGARRHPLSRAAAWDSDVARVSVERPEDHPLRPVAATQSADCAHAWDF